MTDAVKWHWPWDKKRLRRHMVVNLTHNWATTIRSVTVDGNLLVKQVTLAVHISRTNYSQKSKIDPNFKFEVEDVKITTAADVDRCVKFTREHQLHLEPHYQILRKQPGFDVKYDGLEALIKLNVANGVCNHAEIDGELIAFSLATIKCRGDLFAYNPSYPFKPFMDKYLIMKELTCQQLFTNPDYMHVNKILFIYYGCIHNELKGKHIMMRMYAKQMKKNLEILEREKIDGLASFCTVPQTQKLFQHVGGVAVAGIPKPFHNMYSSTGVDLGKQGTKLMYVSVDNLRKYMKEKKII